MTGFKTTLSAAFLALMLVSPSAAAPALPFGEKWPMLEKASSGEWWKAASNQKVSPEQGKDKKGRAPKRLYNLNVPRDEVIAFALYTHDRGVLKLSAQLFPLFDDEAKEARLELEENGEWKEVAKEEVIFPGWSAHFRIENWDNSKTVPYRVRHGKDAVFEGSIRKDPVDKDEIVVGNLSCDSSRTKGPRPNILKNLLEMDPDVLFFAGDQTYHHTEHTAGWIEFGMRYRDVMKDRPTITIPDDHDVGQANLWGENGKVAKTPAGPAGGYFYAPEYVNMVQRQQTWHLPDAHDPKPIDRGITVYYTNLRIGGIDFAILEDRKFKSGPEGKIPKMGPRPDHINDPVYDRSAVDVEGLKLLGDRQLAFLNAWSQDWSGADMKAVLSQTAFCGAVHIHGQPDNRLLADLDSNAWPQTGRNKALREIRRAWASHLCGDQHLAVSVRHGIDAYDDGPYAFTSPAIVNTIYGRWWHPEDEKAGPNPVPNSPLPWTGNYEDGLGNKITMLAYANPEDRTNEKKRADGFGIARYNKKDRTTTFECYDRWADVSKGAQQFPGWPITFKMEDNDGRKKSHWLPVMEFKEANPVVQVITEADGEILYTVRIQGTSFQPAVYAAGTYTVKAGADKPDQVSIEGIQASTDKDAAGEKEVK
ncbi:MAG: hypothetical protein P1U87_05460 [Verrucomicrobiales bacterium]|nr:hypothetical protein [Verrucomicrobiales bacterium]